MGKRYSGSHLGSKGKKFDETEYGGKHGPIAEGSLHMGGKGTKHRGVFDVDSFGGIKGDDNSNKRGKDGC